MILGEAVQLQVQSTGTAPITFQWFKDDVELPNQTIASLVLENIRADQAGNYYVKVSNEAGSLNSSIASVAVVIPPEIVQQPISKLGGLGLKAQFDVVVTGTQKLDYQWFKIVGDEINIDNGVVLEKETSNVLIIDDLSQEDEGAYFVKISNVATEVFSEIVTLEVMPSIDVQLTQNNAALLLIRHNTKQEAIVEASTDFIEWTEIGKVILNNGLGVIVDFESTDLSNRFYRARFPSEDFVIADLGMPMIALTAGSFNLGGNRTAIYSPTRRAPDGPITNVTISKPFWMGQFEVTQAQYKTIVGDNPSKNHDNQDLPVENLSWVDAMRFCQILNNSCKKSVQPGFQYRLPTETEWEYACRAGTQTEYSFGNDFDSSYAWSKSDSGGRTQIVGQKLPNSWGLHDMHGNVWEWCYNKTGTYPGGQVTDYIGPLTDGSNVFRGGSNLEKDEFLGSSFRHVAFAMKFDNVGFRIVLAPKIEDL